MSFLTKNTISPRKFAGFGNAGSAHPLELVFSIFVVSPSRPVSGLRSATRGRIYHASRQPAAHQGAWALKASIIKGRREKARGEREREEQEERRKRKREHQTEEKEGRKTRNMPLLRQKRAPDRKQETKRELAKGKGEGQERRSF